MAQANAARNYVVGLVAADKIKEYKLIKIDNNNRIYLNTEQFRKYTWH